MAETGVIPEGEGDPNRRDFIHIAAGAAAVGAITVGDEASAASQPHNPTIRLPSTSSPM